MTQDFKELLSVFNEHEVKYLIHFIGLAELIRNKRVAGRAQDLADAESVEKARGRPSD